VDPENQRNLVWRKVGRTRIEIQMPSTTGEARSLRQNKEQAIENVLALNISRGETEAALQMPADQRPAAFDDLLANLQSRAAELEKEDSDKAKQAAARLRALREKRQGLLNALSAARDTAAADQTAEAAKQYDDKLRELLATNLEPSRLRDVLGLEKDRDQQLAGLKFQFDAYAHAIDQADVAYGAWAGIRGLIDDPEDLKRLLRGAGVLEFRILAERDPTNPTGRLESRVAELTVPVTEYLDQLEQRGPRRKQGRPYQWFKVEDPADFLNIPADADIDRAIQEQGRYVMGKYAGEYYILAYDIPSSDPRCFTLLKGGDKDTSRAWKLKSAYVGRDYNTGRQVVYFNLDAAGGELFGKLTGANLKKPLGIFLDGACMSAPYIQSQIFHSGQITGNFSAQELDFLVKTLEAGSLPARLKEPPLSERSIGSSLGETNLQRGLRSAVIASIAVAAFMLVYYLLGGLIANVALALNLLYVLAFMATLEATFTLPGIAGLVLTVGMAVDANVLIFERMREELRRGSSLRMAIKNGYDRAFVTIFDSNVTTVITCVILYYSGNEELKGFALVLALGLIINMFTSLWVTRWILAALVQGGIIKSMPMLKLIGVPNIPWIQLRRVFWPISVVLVFGSLALFFYENRVNKANIYDIELIGGTAVTVQLRPGVQISDEELRRKVTGQEQDSASGWLRHVAESIPGLDVRPGQVGGTFLVHSPELTAPQLEMVVMTRVAQDIEPAGKGLRALDPHTLEVTVRSDRNYDLAKFKSALADCASYLHQAAGFMASARVQSDKQSAGLFDISTTETNQEVLRQAIVQVMKDDLQVQLPINYTPRKDAVRAPDGFYALTGGETTGGALRLRDVIGGEAMADIDRFRGGVGLVFDNLTPAETSANIRERLAGTRLLPEFEQYEYRDFEIVPLATMPEDAGLPVDQRRMTSFALLVADEHVVFDDNPELWESALAKPEMDKAQAALSQRKTLTKVTQFAPQVAADYAVRAIMAMLLALVMIVIYVAVRFGDMNFGLAAIVALVHDVAVTVGAIAISSYLARILTGWNFLLITDFKIDLAMVGAFLTIVGFSINDTIVIFDRIRENRGKLKQVNERMIDASINQTLSRTILTSFTVILALLIMYIFGGPGIHGFCFAMLVGCISGTYSTLAIATPLVLRPNVLKWVVYALVGAALLGLTQITPRPELQVILWIVLIGFLAYVGFRELRGTSGAGRLARA
jgi:SecD/SecF fusion protein